MNLLKLRIVLDFFVRILRIHLLDGELLEVALNDFLLVVDAPAVLKHWSLAHIVSKSLQSGPHEKIILTLQHTQEVVSHNGAQPLHPIREFVAVSVSDLLEHLTHQALTCVLL